MANELKPCLASFIKWTRQHHANWNLSPVHINGQFSKFMDPDTDTAWLGFEAAWNTRHAAPVEGLDTVETQMRCLLQTGNHQWRNPRLPSELSFIRANGKDEAGIPYELRELVTRSQAEAINASKDARIEFLERVTADQETQIVKQSTLEADNAALTARVKELEEERVQQSGEWVRFCEAIGIEIDTHEAVADAINTARSNDNYDRQALETQLAAAEKIAFEHGYVLACCNIVNLHDEPTIAHDALSELGVTRQAVKAMNLSEFDMKALRKIERGSAGSPYAKANRKVRAALVDRP
ncbi:hypothetical protein [Ochrobactrum chromiisoli]|uniref:Uncharacterized protein n=1 Tax=Ochrobactrum chromiisoli TaxID=2993941 RepID=A0ABT3QM39_9HYPH|nr:hypothetical protein [Ochrobactrum chromiisoli]MCX2696669.1 hypothetical protein [Ochrobactrum chromiisoli]